jgi:putative heme-binding domain-containing protein
MSLSNKLNPVSLLQLVAERVRVCLSRRCLAALALLAALAFRGPVLRAADSPPALPRLTSLLGETADVQFQKDILRGLTAAFQGQRTLPMPAGWEAIELRLAASADAEVRTLAQALALKFGSQTALTELRKLAVDVGAEMGLRRAALDSLIGVRDRELPKLLQRLVSDPAVRSTAIRALAGFDDSATPVAILAVFPKLLPDERREALNSLASRVAFAKPLVAAVVAGAVPRTELTADLVRQLRNLKDEEIARQLDQVWGVMRETNPDQKKEIERYRRLYGAGGSTPGDAPRGRAVFQQICGQCHRLFDAGGQVGPDITGANRGDLSYLLETILFPNAVIPNDYRASTIETKDERVITGIVKEQNGNTLVVQTATEVLTLPRNEVKKIEPSDQSMMPEGLLANLKDQEVRDLLYYVSRPGQVPLPVGSK